MFIIKPPEILDIDQMHYDPVPAMPRLVLMDMDDAIDTFKKKIEVIDEVDFSIEDVMSDLIAILQRKEDSLYELAYSGYEIFSELENTYAKNLADLYVNARHQLGVSLARELEMYNLYRDGFLYYGYNNLMCRALVMEKINVPYTDDQRRKINLRRSIDSAVRRLVK